VNHVIKLRFDDDDLAVLGEIGHRLRARGWAAHVTVPRLLREWQKLSARVDHYTAMIEEYLNDLMARDGLEIALEECHEPLRTKLMIAVAEADNEFLARTQEDVGQVLARYFHIKPSAEWWWRRRPVVGPLAELLTRS
jgi:hypothetical protein